MTSNPFSPPNAIDLANAPWITPCPACTRNCTPTNVAYARLEKTENMLLKNPPNDPSTRFSREAPTRNPSATAVATPTTTQAFVVVSGPRHTASTAMPESSVSTIDIPGIRATRLGASRSSNHGAAISPGRNARKNSPTRTRSVWSGFASAPGWFSSRVCSATAAASARSTTSCGGV